MTGTTMTVLVVIGIGVLLAAVLALVLVGRLRRLSRARTQLRDGVTRGLAALPARHTRARHRADVAQE